ncbi:DUF3772 domain-containing protein [Pararhodobacter zhoushanensis]|uniref:DUF3772 domain-containing protein n=1 Tax=Pararhodobacter zhoushanensis TaxID=2479545 RepID=UPI0013E0587F|nr:DUF3772 domain-containing protein [Pararhodobacter zhoushanensis]
MVRWPLAALIAVLLAFSLAAPLTAQTSDPTAAATAQAAPTEINYDAWNALASLAEQTLEDSGAADEVLNSIRAEVVTMRTQFIDAQTAMQGRIDALREQIAALGPVPEEGQTESQEVADRRNELNALLAEREAPMRAADEALTRAERIIRDIDRELRLRQANALMTLGPTPLNPSTWLDAADAVINSVLTLKGEAMNAWQDPAHREEMISDLPLTLGTLALAALLLFRGRHWMETLTMRLLQSTTLLRGRAVAAFFLSLSQLIVPFLGLLLLSTAIKLSRMTGPTILEISDALVPAGMAIFFTRWLSLHIFPIVDDPRLSLNLNAIDRRRARGLALVFGFLSAIETLFTPFIAPQWQPDTAMSALNFPLVVLCALTMLRFSRLLRRHEPRRAIEDGVEVDTSPYFDRMLTLGSRVLMFFGIAAPLLGAAGYMAAALQLTYPAIKSLALIALIMVLHRLITAIYITIVGDDERSARGLVPALAGLLLSMLALAPLALIWGARQTDLVEIWTRFSEGVSLGGARISPASVFWFFIVFAIGFLVTRALQGALGTSVLPKTSMEKGAQKAIISGVGYVGITAAALAAFSVAGIDLSGLAIVAGALSVGVGFGLQAIVSNFVSGIILLIERPVSEGDWIEVGPTQGTVQRISVRSTTIETFDRSKVIVPNADLISGAVTNYTKSSKTGRVVMTVGVAYGTDTRKVERILREIIEAEPLVVLDPAPGIDFLGFGADALDFRIRAILRDVTYKVVVASEVNHKIAARFIEEGIEIPYAQRDIWLRNPEALTQMPPAAKKPVEPEDRPAREFQPEPRMDRDTADSAGISSDESDDIPPEDAR